MEIGLVLPGGGARGAYEVGALSVLLPALEARGERVTIVCGTSVGGINAAFAGALAALPAAEQAAQLLERWRALRKGDVIAPVIGPGSALALLRLAGEVLELPGLRAASLMDPSPLARHLDRWIDWDRLHGNIRSGLLRAVCVIATSLDRGIPVGFVESERPAPRSDASIEYVPTLLASEHVRASAAIPMLFPPVAVSGAAAGHYVDGATRLNAPISPALALGAERIIVIGNEPWEARAPRPADGGPRLADVAANMLDGLLLDQIGHDVRRMLAVNAFFAESATTGSSRAARAYREARGRPPYRRISYALVAPQRRGEIGELAEAVFRQRYGALRGLRSPDFLLLARLLGGGRARSRGELLSFMLFDEVFIERLLEAGQRDASCWLDEHPGFWTSESVGEPLEAIALDEFRALRRR